MFVCVYNVSVVLYQSLITLFP